MVTGHSILGVYGSRKKYIGFERRIGPELGHVGWRSVMGVG